MSAIEQNTYSSTATILLISLAMLCGCERLIEEFLEPTEDAGEPSQPTTEPPPSFQPVPMDLGGASEQKAHGVPPGIYTALEARGFITCGLRADEAIACWSETGSSIDSAQGSFAALGSGEANVCGVRRDGAIICPNQLVIDRELPLDVAEIPSDGPFAQVAGGRGFLCGLKQDGVIVCRGKRTADVPTPPGGTYRQVVAGDRFVCGLSVHGSVSCTAADDLSKVSLSGMPYVQIAASRSDLCGAKSDGSLSCSAGMPSARQLAKGTKLRSVALGAVHGCGVKTAGDLACWGSQTLPQQLPSGPFRSVAVSTTATCALREIGSVECWGGSHDTLDPQPQAPAGPVTVEVEEIMVNPNERREDVRGLTVTLRCKSTGGGPNTSVSLGARLTNAQGQSIRATVRRPMFHGGAGHVGSGQSLIVAGEGTSTSTALFVPFFLMDLPQGPQKLRVQVEPSGGVASQVGSSDVPVKVQGHLERVFDVVKPPVRMVSVMVASVQVEPDAYDASLLRSHKARPDLMWEAHFGQRFVGGVHRSRIQNDTYIAAWQQGTGSFPFSEGDRLTVSVFDEDVASDDLIGAFSFSVEELERQARQNVPLSRGKVQQLLFGSIQVR